MTRAAGKALSGLLGKTPLGRDALRWWRRGKVQRPVYPAKYSRLDSRVVRAWRGEVSAAAAVTRRLGRRILVFAHLPWQVPLDVGLALLLAGLGHRVDLAILPYWELSKREAPLEVRRRRHKLLKALRELEPALKSYDLSTVRGTRRVALPTALLRSLRDLSFRDTQYCLGREDIEVEGREPDAEIFRLRLQRNKESAAALSRLFDRQRYDTVVIHNGNVGEYGAAYQTAREWGLPTVTQEFGEQRHRCWLSQGAPVLEFDEMTNLWRANSGGGLGSGELEAVREWQHARRAARPWESFTHVYQTARYKGGENARARLGLNASQPVALLCANVVWDTASLGRQVFTEGMSDWIRRTVGYFAHRDDCQLVVRIHPMDRDGTKWGVDLEDIARTAVGALPAHIKIVRAESDISTYDLIDIAHMGLAYTSTAGLDMVLAGVPVVCCGRAHYRGKGFTVDPQTLQEYYHAIDAMLSTPKNLTLSADQVKLAWLYAYLFLFELPKPYPWVQASFWEDIEAWPLSRVLSPEGLEIYGPTLDLIAGQSSSMAFASL